MVLHTLYVTDEAFEPEYPPGVRPQSLEGTAKIVGMRFVNCRQADHGSVIQENFSFLTFEILIEPPGGDTNITFPTFLFQAYSNSPSLVENASRSYGLDIQLVDSIPFDRTPITPSPYSSSAYIMTAPPGASPDYKVEGHVWEESTIPRQEVEAYYFQNATGELNHLRLDLEGNTYSGSGGVVTFGPNSYWAQHSDVENWDHVNLPYKDVTAELRFVRGV